MASGLLLAGPVAAQEPGWSGPIIARGPQREAIEKTEIHLRPYRPLHFYGNTVRRTYYRGNPLPTFRDFTAGVQALMSQQPPPPPSGF